MVGLTDSNMLSSDKRLVYIDLTGHIFGFVLSMMSFRLEGDVVSDLLKCFKSSFCVLSVFAHFKSVLFHIRATVKQKKDLDLCTE